MPLIFSTYKLKLGGILTTSNLFSKFLYKDIEQAVHDRDSFHAIKYAFWKNRAAQKQLLHPKEVATSSRLSQAFPFWHYKEIASHLNASDSGYGALSAHEKPVLFLPWWRQGSHDVVIRHTGVGDFKSQASWDDAYRFFTEYGHVPYEIVFDGSESVGVLGRHSPAFPFWAEEVFAEEVPQFDFSYADGVEGRYGKADFFFTSINEGLTPVYDKSRTGESLLSQLRLEPQFYAELGMAQHTQLRHGEEAAELTSVLLGSPDPFMPDLYRGSAISRFKQLTFEVNRFIHSNAVDFYAMLEDGIDYPFLHRTESSGECKAFGFNTFLHETFQGNQPYQERLYDHAVLKSFFGFNSFWHDVYPFDGQHQYGDHVPESVFVSMYGAEPYHYEQKPADGDQTLFGVDADSQLSGLREAEKLFTEYGEGDAPEIVLGEPVQTSTGPKIRTYQFFFHYKNDGVVQQDWFNYNTADVQQSISVPSAFLELHSTFVSDNSSVEKYVPSYAVDWIFSPAVFFYSFLNPAAQNQGVELGQVESYTPRSADFFWYYKNNGSYDLRMHGSTATWSMIAYYDIIFETAYPATHIRGEGKVPEGKLTELRRAEPIYYWVKPTGADPVMWGNSNTTFTYMSHDMPVTIRYFDGICIANVISGISSNASPSTPTSVMAAIWVNHSDKNHIIMVEAHSELRPPEAVMAPYVWLKNIAKSVDIIWYEACPTVTMNMPADVQPYYTQKFAGSIVEDLHPNSLTIFESKSFATPHAINSYVGEHKEKDWENLNLKAAVGDTGLSIIEIYGDFPKTEYKAINDGLGNDWMRTFEATHKATPTLVDTATNSYAGVPVWTNVPYEGYSVELVPNEREYWFSIPLSMFAQSGQPTKPGVVAGAGREYRDGVSMWYEIPTLDSRHWQYVHVPKQLATLSKTNWQEEFYLHEFEAINDHYVLPYQYGYSVYTKSRILEYAYNRRVIGEQRETTVEKLELV